MKAILVIEMPEGCAECDLSNGVHGNRENCLNHDFFVTDKDFYVRPSWCPLRPLPQKKLSKYPIWADKSYDDFDKGYNACLAEIVGEEE